MIDTPGDISILKLKLDHKDGIGDPKRLKDRIHETILESMGVESEIELLPEGSIASTSKAIRFVKTFSVI